MSWNPFGPSDTEIMQKQLFQLKFTSKQMARAHKKAEKDEEAEKKKIKKSMEKGDEVSARIYAQNAIRIKTQGINYLRMSSRLDAVSSRIEGAIKMKQVTKQMGGVVKGMDKVLATMDVDKISSVMDKFEASFEQMDVTSSYIEGAMNSSTAGVQDEGAVDSLLAEVQAAHGMEVGMSAASAGTSAVTAPAGQAAPNASAEEALEKRLAALRQ